MKCDELWFINVNMIMKASCKKRHIDLYEVYITDITGKEKLYLIYWKQRAESIVDRIDNEYRIINSLPITTPTEWH